MRQVFGGRRERGAFGEMPAARRQHEAAMFIGTFYFKRRDAQNYARVWMAEPSDDSIIEVLQYLAISTILSEFKKQQAAYMTPSFVRLR